MAARTPITVNIRRTNERWEFVFKPKQGRNTFRGSKNDFQLKFRITLLDEPNESGFNLQGIAA